MNQQTMNQQTMNQNSMNQTTQTMNNQNSIIQSEMMTHSSRKSDGQPTERNLDMEATVYPDRMDNEATIYPEKQKDDELLLKLLSNKRRREERKFMSPISSDKDTFIINGVAYTKLSNIGRGGSSKVYKVMRQHDRQIFALKRVRMKGISKSTYQGFLNEVELLKRLKGKPNIIQYIDSEFRKHEHVLFLVIELGEIDLGSMLKEQKQCTDIQIRAYWYQMLQAVHTIHEDFIIHSDLKPANFLLVKGTLKLIDFGIATRIERSDTTNILRDNSVGTVNYMPPEAFENKQLDHHLPQKFKLGRSSDIWSLGCILYQMVYGHPPFAKIPNMVQKIQAICSEKYQIPFPDLKNKDLLNVLQLTLQRNPKARPTIPQLLEHKYLVGTPDSRGILSPKTTCVDYDQLCRLCRFACSFIEDENAKQKYAKMLVQLLEEGKDISPILNEIINL